MPLTNFPYGVTSFGVPLIGGGGFMSGGTHIFCDPANGNDGNDGLSWDKAKKTLDGTNGAYALATSGKNDVIYLIGDGSTSATARITTTGGLLWTKNATHLIGVTAPTRNFQRARVSHSSTAGVGVTHLITISGDGCVFANIQFFQGYSTDEDQTCIELSSGDRNFFYNCHFAGGGHATPAARANTNSLTLTSASENTFYRCTFGLTTIPSSAANASVLTAGSECRDNYFEDCDFVRSTSSATTVHLNVAASSIVGFMTFRNCAFINNVGTSGGTTMTAALTVSATCGGDVVLYNPMFVGATDITAADSTKTWVLGFGTNPSGNLNTGLATNTDVS